MSKPQSTTIREAIRHSIANGRIEIVATSSGWYIEITLHGPDMRYNSTYLRWGSSEILGYIDTANRAWEKFNFLSSDDDVKESDLDIKVADGFSICFRKYLPSGVLFYGRTLFTDDYTYKSFVDSLNEARKRGITLVGKCQALDKI